MDHVYRLGRQLHEMQLGGHLDAWKVHDAACNFINQFTDWCMSSEARRSLHVVYRMAQMETNDVSIWIETARQN